MNFDDLKMTFEKELSLIEQNSIEVNSAIKQAQKADRHLKMSLYIETGACVFLLGGALFALIAGWPLNTLLLISLSIFIVMSAFIPFKMIRARQSALQDTWSLQANINREIEKLTKQKHLLSNVATWYVAPLFVAIITGSWGGYALRTGTYMPDLPLLIYWGVVTVLGVAIIYWNQYSANKNIAPALNNLLELKQQLEKH